ncbi:hypothetical protein Y032_0035g3117 [Ancylostoma ceylanicum]|uniref:Uncharacterized protein n=1 Tax=Ancylostoma ceylanicum TaxID=53326 RepID=A0A016UMD0_9BILA|nr:hypothetical protein Y032_0035g3117 [Ancylostoma ceylanicum]
MMMECLAREALMLRKKVCGRLCTGFIFTELSDSFIFYTKLSTTLYSGLSGFAVGIACSPSRNQCGVLSACSRDTLLLSDIGMTLKKLRS